MIKGWGLRLDRGDGYTMWLAGMNGCMTALPSEAIAFLRKEDAERAAGDERWNPCEIEVPA